MTRDLVFVSYSHLDTAWRELLHVMLKPWIYDGLKYWADDYIQVGDEWERRIDGAIERARVAVLLLSHGFFASRFIRERELPPLLAAANQGALRLFCLPVEPCTYGMAALQRFQFPWVTALRSQAEAERLEAMAAVAKLIAGEFELQGKLVAHASERALAPIERGETVAELFGAPDLPPHYRPRSEELGRIKSALLSNECGTVGIGAVARHGVQGIGGVGKTVLARALAGDDDTRAAFPNGVFWLSLGQAPDVLQLQVQLARWLGDSATFTNPVDARDCVRKLLADKRCLLVLDDVWHYEHVRGFDVLGPRGRLLVTTRDKQILSTLGGHTTSLDVLDEDSALALLAEGAGVAREALPAAALAVAKECGRLPLALTLAAAQMRDGVSWEHVLSALRAGDLAFLDHPHGSIFKTLDASMRALPADESARYRELSFVPEDARVPESVIARYWQHAAGLATHATAKLLRRFAARGLLSLHEGAVVEVSFHDLQLDYLRLVAAQDGLAHQRALLDAFAQLLPRTAGGLPRWGALPPEDTYLWKNLSHHLLEAQRADELKAAVCDVRWLKGKMQIQGLAWLLVELAQVVPRLLDADCAHVERVLCVDGGRLYLHPTALENLLYTRLRCEGWDADHILHTVVDLAPRLQLRHPVYLGSRAERRRFEGHVSWVNACVYSPNGKRVLSASGDGTLREWDAESGEETRRFEEHDGMITACAYSPDGRRVLSGRGDGTLREWDAASGGEIRRFEGHVSIVNACIYREDGWRVLSASGDGTLREWDAASGKEIRRFEGPGVSVQACAYSKLRVGRVLCGGGNGMLVEFDAENGKQTQRFDGHFRKVNACAYSRDGTRVISASDDATLREWDAASGGEIRRFEGHNDFVSVCAYNPGGQRVITGFADGTLRVWDVATGREVHRLDGHSRRVNACAYSPDGERVLSASADGTLREWNVELGEKTVRFDGHTDWISACVFRSDGKHVLSASGDTTLREWDVESGEEVQRFEGHSRRVNACAYRTDGRRLVSASADGTLREWDCESGRETRRFEMHAGTVTACAYSPSGKRVLSACADGVLREWDVVSGKESQRFEGHSRKIEVCAYSPDGKRVLSASQDGSLREWYVENGKALRFGGHPRPVTASTYSPDGRRVLSATAGDGMMREWDVESCKETQRFEGCIGRITACSYSTDRKHVLCASEDCTIRMFRLRDGVCVGAAHGPRAFTSVVAIGALVAAGDVGGNIWLFDVILSEG